MKTKPQVLLLCLAWLVSFSSLSASDSQFDDVDRAIRLRDYDTAFKLLLPKAENGDAQAQYRLADFYRAGEGVPRDLALAARYYRQAAEQGLAAAQYSYASLLIRQDKVSEALVWMRKSASQGHRLAKRKLRQFDEPLTESAILATPAERVFDDILHQRRTNIKALIQAGYDFNILDRHRRTPLMLALQTDHIDLAKLLLPRTTLVNQQDDQGVSALHFAVMLEDQTFVEALLQRGVAVDALDDLGNTPLMLAVRRDQAMLVSRLLESGADGYVDNRKGHSPFQIAVQRKNAKVVKVFRKFGLTEDQTTAAVTIDDIKQWSAAARKQGDLYPGWPLSSIAAHLGEDEILRQLLTAGVDVSDRDADGNSALHRASAQGNLGAIRLLLDHGANIDAPNKKKETPLLLASRSGKGEAVNELLKLGADPRKYSLLDETPLLAALRNRHEAVAQRLSGISPQGSHVHQAVIESLEAGFEQVALQLMKNDQYLAVPDDHGRTLLWYSIENDMQKVSLKLLSNTGLELNQIDDQGYSPFQKALKKGSLAVARAMLEQGVDPKVRTSEGNTLLMLAVAGGSEALVKELLSAADYLDATNNSGDTALIIAANSGEPGMVKLLIDHGADILRRNHDDLNAAQVAQRAGFPDIASLIEQNSGSVFSIFK